MAAGTLYVVATPIGNLGDMTFRAVEVLRSVDRVAAEDTRHTLKLLTHYQIRKPLVSYHSHNLEESGAVIAGRLQGGEDIALVTDAGTPGISDPGARLIQQVLELEIDVCMVPGPTASVAALVISGLPTQPFAFLGFPPPRGGSRRRFFTQAAPFPMTLVLYESARRLGRTLSDIEAFWGDRRIAVARELTKLHEEVFRGSVSEARHRLGEGVKGEVTLVVAGADARPSGTAAEEETWKLELEKLLAQGSTSTRDAVDQVAARFGAPRRKVYQEALRLAQIHKAD
ncbi:MAG: 16S rRNA (cytidine(1402)-2'-O)-methyltransferase [Syntrophobacteraceae bacterium]|nr:16S rRNA (cytidine(1402)-2'-O)-methyltransferase [Syntrophobacteraceae bacterium]